MKIVVVEDELLAFKELVRMLVSINPEIEVVAHLKSAQEIKNQLSDLTVDLIFCDINLPDGNSIEALTEVDSQVPIIFTTAYDNFAIKAFEFNSIDYLLKPISESDLRRAISKYQNRISEQQINYDELKNLIQPTNSQAHRKRFLVKIGDKYTYIETNKIAYFYAEDKLTFARSFEGKNLIIEESLNDLEETLDHTFFRVSRNMICSISSINSASKHFNSRLILDLNPSSDVPVLVSRVRVPNFLNWLNS